MKKSKENLLYLLSLVGLVIFFWSALPIATGVMNVGSGLAMAFGLCLAIYALMSLKYPKESIPYKKDQDQAYKDKLAAAQCKKTSEKSGMRHTILFGTKNVDLDQYDRDYDDIHMAGLVVSREARDVIDKIAIVIIAIVIAFVGFMSATLMDYNKFDGNYRGKTVVVLGAGIDGDKPSMILQARLDKTLELMKEADRDVKCIVSGGQGEDESFTESYVMKKYLVENGLAEDKIIEEEMSGTTKENLEYSKEIANKKDLPTDFILVTQGFHQHRAEEYAKDAGIHSEGAKAYTSKGLWLGYWARESIAVFVDKIGILH